MKNKHKKKNNELEWLHFVRREELKIIVDILKSRKNIKILEIGGGDGFQAKILNENGFHVISIDTEPRFPQLFPVEKINNSELNFSDETFDIIFTSHVLPHIYDLEQIFNEIRRVLKKDGIMLHIVPTTGWSFITNIWHYLFIPKYVLKSIKKKLFNKPTIQTFLEQSTQLQETNENKLKKLFLHPLGENPSFIHELVYFSHRYWKKLFLDAGFTILDIKCGPYVTSGYGVFSFKLISLRKFFAKYIFSSSFCFILKK